MIILSVATTYWYPSSLKAELDGEEMDLPLSQYNFKNNN